MRAVVAVTVMHVLLFVLHVCVLWECEGVLCFGCGGVGREWVGGLDKGRERWGGVMSV